MFFKSTKYALIGLAIFVSANAEAKFVQFSESFTGSFAQDSTIDFGYFMGQSTFFNGSVSLITNHEVVNYLPDFYVANGTYTRADGTGAFSGRFDLETTLPDYGNTPPPNVFPIVGNFYTDSFFGGPNVNTGAYKYVFATGNLKGFISGDPANTYANFTIDWTIVTPNAISAVPEPDTVWLFGAGLLCLVALRRKSAISQIPTC